MTHHNRQHSGPPGICTECGRKFVSHNAMQSHRADTHANPNWKGPSKKEKTAPLCPMCGEPAQLSEGKYGIKAECCGLWSWGLRPLVSKGTHIARINAHSAFDPVWKSGRLSRGEAYRRFAILMGLSQSKCHISLMSYEDAMRVSAVLAGGEIFDEQRFSREQAA